MDKQFLFTLILLLSFQALSEDKKTANITAMSQYEIFNYENQSKLQKEFATVEEMVDYLKRYRQKTYFYYQKLDSERKRKTFVEHIDFPKKDITTIILKQFKTQT